MRLILASASPRRRELLELLQLPYEVCPANVEETIDDSLPPGEIVETLSLRKASAVRAQRRSDGDQDGIVVGSDTIVVLDGQVLGKPIDEQDACRMLRALQGRSHHVYTGVACLRIAAGREEDREQADVILSEDRGANCEAIMHLGDTGRYRVGSASQDGKFGIAVGHTVSKVIFRPMSEGEIQIYVRSGIPMDKAGAYGVQGMGSVFIERIEGDFYSIMGLPLNLLYPMLLACGSAPFSAMPEAHR